MTIFEQLQNYILDQKKEIDNKDYQQGWNDCFTAISDMLTLFFKDASSDPDVINFLIDDEKAEITKKQKKFLSLLEEDWQYIIKENTSYGTEIYVYDVKPHFNQERKCWVPAAHSVDITELVGDMNLEVNKCYFINALLDD